MQTDMLQSSHGRVGLIIAVALLLECLVAGAFFGWPSLALILQRQEYLHDGDDGTTTQPVESVALSLNTIYTTALTLRCFMLLLHAFVLDSFNVRDSLVATGFASCAGVLIMSMAALAGGIGAFYITAIGYAVFGVSAILIHVQLMASMRFVITDPSWIPFIYMCMNCLFDAGIITFWSMRMAIESWSRVSFYALLLMYAWVIAGLSVMVRLLWPPCFPTVVSVDSS